jgi:hypothetical protein
MGRKLLITRPFQSIGRPGSVITVDWDDDRVERFVQGENGIEIIEPKPRKAVAKKPADVQVMIEKADGEGHDQH